jgi:hypothetical protein
MDNYWKNIKYNAENSCLNSVMSIYYFHTLSLTNNPHVSDILDSSLFSIISAVI